MFSAFPFFFCMWSQVCLSQRTWDLRFSGTAPEIPPLWRWQRRPYRSSARIPKDSSCLWKMSIIWTVLWCEKLMSVNICQSMQNQIFHFWEKVALKIDHTIIDISWHQSQITWHPSTRKNWLTNSLYLCYHSTRKNWSWSSRWYCQAGSDRDCDVWPSHWACCTANQRKWYTDCGHCWPLPRLYFWRQHTSRESNLW